jgi:hypothetical protein
MARIFIAATLCVGLVSPAFAAGPQDVDTLLRHYDADAVSQGRIEVELSGDTAWVRGTAAGGPWLDVWRRATGEWTLVAELLVAEVAPVRFGAGKRARSCGRPS